MLSQESLKPIEVATASHRLAKILSGRANRSGSSQRRGLEQMATPILRSLPQFGPQATANTLWALAALVCRDAPLVGKMYGTAARCMPEFSGRHLSNVVWSMATLSQGDASLLASVSDRVVADKIKDQLSNQSIANTLWSLAVLDVDDLMLMSSLMETVASSRRMMNSQDVSTVLWALAPHSGTLQREVAWNPFLAGMAKDVQAQASDLPVSELVSIAWAFADIVSSPRKAFQLVSPADRKSHGLQGSKLGDVALIWVVP